MNYEEFLLLDRKYDLVREDREKNLKIIEDFFHDPEKSEQLNGFIREMAAFDTPEGIRSVAVPEDMLLRFLVMCSTIEDGHRRYLARGFSEEETMGYLRAFGSEAAVSYRNTGTFGLTPLYFWWLALYSTASIFGHMGLELEKKTVTAPVVWIRNKKTKEIRGLQNPTKVHRSGHLLGSGGCEDFGGSFEVTYEETDEYFKGHSNLSDDGLIDRNPTVFKKSEWELFLKKGDHAVAFHFPRNANLKKENLDEFFRTGAERIREIYPEFDAKTYFCTTWLLDSKMQKMLPETSNIVAFQKRMTSFPMKSGGMDPFGYVFPVHYDSFESLPEDSTLRRELKKLYIGGDRIYNRFGVLPFDRCF